MTELACPRCGAQMSRVTHEALAVAPCFSCGGLWLSAAAADTLRATLDAQTERSALEASSRAERAMPLRTGGASLACPECRSTMTRFVVAETEVDHCATHGTWFDHGEHERVTAHFRDQQEATVDDDDDDEDSSGLELAREPTRGERRKQVTTPGEAASGAVVAEAMMRAQLIYERDQTERKLEALETWARWGDHSVFWF